MDMIWESKTVENAIEIALKELNNDRDQVEIEVIQEPVKGIFGLTKMAKVKVTPKPGAVKKPVEEKAVSKQPYSKVAHDPGTHVPITQEAVIRGQENLDKMLKLMGINEFEIKGRIEEDSIVLDIKSEAEGLLIGRHGTTREAIQYILERISNNNEKEKIKYIIDIGGYLNRHRETLEKMAERAVKTTLEGQHETHLEAMSAFDRRIVHLFLKDHQEVKTYSQGEGLTRHIVVARKIAGE